MALFGPDSKIAQYVNHLHDYKRQAETFLNSFEGKDLDEVEHGLLETYRKLKAAMPRQDEEYLRTLIGREWAEREIQRIEEGGYLEKLDRAIEARGKKVNTQEKALKVIEAGWKESEDYFQETYRLLQAWEAFLKSGEEFIDGAVETYEHFTSVHEPIELRTGGSPNLGDLSKFKSDVESAMEQREQEFRDVWNEFKELDR